MFFDVDQYKFLNDPRCEKPRLSHQEARQLKRDGNYDELFWRTVRLAYFMAVRRCRGYDFKFDHHELIAIVFLRLLELLHQWKPRKQTFHSYLVLQLRDVTYNFGQEWGTRRKRVKGSGLMDHSVNARLASKEGPSRGCLLEIEEAVHKVLDDDHALFFCRRYGLCGSKQYSYPELEKLYGMTDAQINYRVQQAMQRLHNHFNRDDQIPIRELQNRLWGKRAKSNAERLKPKKPLSTTRGAINQRRYRERRKQCQKNAAG